MTGGVKSKKKLMILVVSASVLLFAIGGVIWFIANRTSDSRPFSSDFIHSVEFPLYYPSALPENYILDEKSIVSDGDTAHYSLVNSVKKLTITVTMQPTPSGFDAAKIIGSNPIPTSIMPSGTLYNLSIGGNSKYMFTTSGGALMFITSATAIPSEDMNTIANGLKEVGR